MTARSKPACIGMTLEESTIVKGHVTVGAAFKKGDILDEVEAEKVTNEVGAHGDGKMIGIPGNEGEIAEVGQEIHGVEGHD